MSLAEDRARLQATEREERLAFEALVHRQTRFVFRVANAMLRNARDAEEVAQETFLKLHRGGAWRCMRDERDSGVYKSENQQCGQGQYRQHNV